MPRAQAVRARKGAGHEPCFGGWHGHLDRGVVVTLSFLVLSVLVIAVVLYALPIRGWYRRSGARHLDASRAMSGDVNVLSPDYESTLTILIDAPPADVWPCLLQMGRGRRSQRTTEDIARLKPGDSIRVTLAPAFPIKTIEPGRMLILGDAGALQWSWQFELYAIDVNRTRLISRTRVAARTAGETFIALFLQPISFVITRKMLFDVKRRAESLTADASHDAGAQRPAAIS